MVEVTKVGATCGPSEVSDELLEALRECEIYLLRDTKKGSIEQGIDTIYLEKERNGTNTQSNRRCCGV